MSHRHEFQVIRRERNTGHPLIRECSCGHVERWHRGRWVESSSASKAVRVAREAFDRRPHTNEPVQLPLDISEETC